MGKRYEVQFYGKLPVHEMAPGEKNRPALFQVYINYAGKTEAIKYGWSWPAFCFNTLWGFWVGLWKIGLSFLLLLFAVNVAIHCSYGDGLVADALHGAAELPVALLFGWKGNSWRVSQLISRGYVLKTSVTAGDEAEAVAKNERERD